MTYDLPSADLLREQADWLSPARSRLLRQIGIAHRKRILDLGCGHGVVTEELVRRGGGTVWGLDHHLSGLSRALNGICGDAPNLPFTDGVFDLVFCQLALMWMPLEQTVSEIARVITKGGVVVAIEPDYGGMLEWPEGVGLKEIWIAALTRAGADPFVGRKLPRAYAQEGFDVRVETTSEIQPPRAERFELLRELPLSLDEQRKVEEIEKGLEADFSLWEVLAHLPFVMVVGSRSK